MSNDKWSELAGKLSAAGIFYMGTDDLEQIERLCFEHGITVDKKEVPKEISKEDKPKEKGIKNLFKKKK